MYIIGKELEHEKEKREKKTPEIVFPSTKGFLFTQISDSSDSFHFNFSHLSFQTQFCRSVSVLHQMYLKVISL